jgi:hypothetical protein
MPRVVHFEISADDPERVSRFYSSVFGWDIQRWPGPAEYWLVTTGPNERPGINGGIFIRQGPVGHVITIDVPDIDAYLRAVTEQGGEVVVPKRAIPGVGYTAYCKDTEGSTFGLVQTDPAAQ